MNETEFIVKTGFAFIVFCFITLVIIVLSASGVI